MIAITRSLARHLRAVFRHCLTKDDPRAAMVSFSSSAQGLHVRLYGFDGLAEYHLAGSGSNELLALPLKALMDFEGSDATPVHLEGGSAGAVQVKWSDRGIPQAKEYAGKMPSELPTFPEAPDKWHAQDPGLRKALHDAVQVAGSPGRFATDKIQLQGKTGHIVGTDHRQLLIQSGFSLPWAENLLVPAIRVFGCKELPDAPIAIGKIKTHVAVRVGAWTFYLRVDTQSRYPPVEDVIPKATTGYTKCTVHPDDASFLSHTLPYLLVDHEKDQRITLDLHGQAAIRSRPEGQSKCQELVLARSQVTGRPMRFNTNRQYLMRMLELGFSTIQVLDPDRIIYCQDQRRKYAWMSLGKEGALEPSDNALKIVSTDPLPTSHPSPRTKPIMSEPTPTNTNGRHPSQRNAAPANKRKLRTGGHSLVDEAASLRNELRQALVRTNELFKAVKQQQRQRKLLNTTLANLKQLQNT
jgi:hypothetical protein